MVRPLPAVLAATAAVIFPLPLSRGQYWSRSQRQGRRRGGLDRNVRDVWPGQVLTPQALTRAEERHFATTNSFFRLPTCMMHTNNLQPVMERRALAHARALRFNLTTCTVALPVFFVEEVDLFKRQSLPTSHLVPYSYKHTCAERTLS